MPTLPTPHSATAGELPISGGRRASAEDLYGGGAADAGAKIRHGLNEYVQDAEQDEARKVLVASSEIRAKYARALDEAAASGADTVALKEQMTNELAKVGEQFQTRKGQDSLAVATSNSELMYDEQANKINVQRAVSQARLDAHKFLNNAAAIMRSNPLYLEAAEKDADAFGATIKGPVRPEQRAEIVDGLKKELNMAAALASSRSDPEATKKKLEGGAWNLTPEQREHAVVKADTEIRARRAEDAYLRAEDERIKRDLDDTARDKQFAAIIGGTATRRQIMDDADLRPQTREHLIVFMEHRSKEINGQEKKSDPTVVRNLWIDIHRPDDDPKKIYTGDAIFAAVQRGAVNTTDANQLNTLVANQKDENNKTIGSKLSAQMSIVGRALSQDPKFTAQPALVAEIQLDYQARVFDKVKQLRDDKQNPNDVFNPASKDFVGSREFIQGSINSAMEKQRQALPQIPAPTTKEEYDALEKGTTYRDTDGRTKVKKEKATAPAKGPTTSGVIQR